MKKNSFLLLMLICSVSILHAQQTLDSLLPVRGFCIAAPSPKNLDRFILFIDEELAPRKVNTLILRVDYNYQSKSHSELADSNALSNNDVKKLVKVCRKNHINLYTPNQFIRSSIMGK